MAIGSGGVRRVEIACGAQRRLISLRDVAVRSRCRDIIGAKRDCGREPHATRDPILRENPEVVIQSGNFQTHPPQGRQGAEEEWRVYTARGVSSRVPRRAEAQGSEAEAVP